VSEWGDVSVS